MNADILEKLTYQTLDLLLRGDDPALSILRQQVSSLEGMEIEFTGVGFYARFSLSDETDRLPNRRNATFGDVIGVRSDGEPGFGFNLFIRDGIIATLEGFTYEDDWPLNLDDYELKYEGSERGFRNLFQ